MIYFFYGDEEFNISNEIKKLKSNLDKDFIEMSFKQFNNPKFPDLIAAVRTQPMMFGKMLIVINCLTYLSGKSSDENGFDDKQIKQLTEALDNVLLLNFHRIARKKSTNEKKYLNFYQNITQRNLFKFHHTKQQNLKVGLNNRQNQKI